MKRIGITLLIIAILIGAAGMSFRNLKDRFFGSPEEKFWNWFQANEEMIYQFDKDQEGVLVDVALLEEVEGNRHVLGNPGDEADKAACTGKYRAIGESDRMTLKFRKPAN